MQYFDPYVPTLSYNEIKLNCIDNLNIERIRNFDACVILTDHSNIDYDTLANNSISIIDTRNVFKDYKGKHIRRLGEG